MDGLRKHDLAVDISIASRQDYKFVSTAVFVGLLTFTVLWLLNARYRSVYQPDDNDVTALADGLLLLPGARWQDWFTRGHSHFFDAYPEWPWGLTPFARPAFQFVIYLGHVAFDRDWASYLAINYLTVSGVGAIAFGIARRALGLGRGAALLAAVLVLLSPPLLEFSLWKLGFASEPLASALVGCAFLAVVSRRDVLCLALLIGAVLTKETAVWASLATALTVLVRSGPGDSIRRRALFAGAMLLPVGLWLGLRFAFYGGLSGGYATGAYWPLMDFVKLIDWKFTHLHRLFASQERLFTDGGWGLVDRALMIGTHLLIWLLLLLWAFKSLRSARDRLRASIEEKRWPTVDTPLLVVLWAGMGLAFDFAVTLDSPRYALAAVMFTWPAVVAAGTSGPPRLMVARVALGACLVMLSARASHFLVKFNSPEQSASAWYFRAVAEMRAALAQVPSDIREVYVLPSGGLPTAAPEYLRAVFDIPTRLVRIVDLHEICEGGHPFIFLRHDFKDGLVTIDAMLRPDCASFFFDMAGPGSTAGASGRIRRTDTIDYELPDAYLIDHKGPLKPALELGSHVIVHIRPNGPARFIIEKGGPNGNLFWFDTP